MASPGGVEEQVVELLTGLNGDPGLLPRLGKLYEELREPSASERIAELEERIKHMYQEEAVLACLYAQGKLNDRNHHLHREWQDEFSELWREIASLEAPTVWELLFV